MKKRSEEYRFYCYILANAPRNFYVGFTRDLRKRVWEHKTKAVPCVTNTWNDCRLVYFETWQYAQRAISREKQIKPWRREKKIALIEKYNRDWHDLSDGWYPELEKKKRADAMRL